MTTSDMVTWADIRATPGAPTYPQLNFWTNTGRVTATRGGPGARPRDRRWPRSELRVIVTAARLTRIGMSDLDVVFGIARGNTNPAPGIRVDVVAPDQCTGWTARWCPLHGDCACGSEPSNPRCHLHGRDSDHAEDHSRETVNA
jgi:hypothetical protein